MTKRIQIIDQGRVFCPVRMRDVDIDQCVGCKRLDGIDVDSRHPHVVCQIEQDDIERAGQALA